MAAIPSGWREPTPEDRTPELVGHRVYVWWEDENGGNYYEGRIMDYNVDKDTFKIMYITEPGIAYDEKLEEEWLVFDPKQARMTREQEKRLKAPLDPVIHQRRTYTDDAADEDSGEDVYGGPVGRGRFTNKSTYADMIVAAIEEMEEKNGSSFQAIRRWICYNNPDASRKQKASFNNLTKKAMSKLETDGIVVKVKSSYALSSDYRARKGLAGSSEPFSYIEIFEHGEEKKKKKMGGEVQALMSHRQEVRREWEKTHDTRKRFLLRHRAYIEPFLQERRNYYHKIDAETKRRRDVEERQKREAKLREFEEGLREREDKLVQQIDAERLKATKEAIKPYMEDIRNVQRSEPRAKEAPQAKAAAANIGRQETDVRPGQPLARPISSPKSASLTAFQAQYAPKPEPRPDVSSQPSYHYPAFPTDDTQADQIIPVNHAYGTRRARQSPPLEAPQPSSVMPQTQAPYPMHPTQNTAASPMPQRLAGTGPQQQPVHYVPHSSYYAYYQQLHRQQQQHQQTQGQQQQQPPHALPQQQHSSPLQQPHQPQPPVPNQPPASPRPAYPPQAIPSAPPQQQSQFPYPPNQYIPHAPAQTLQAMPPSPSSQQRKPASTQEVHPMFPIFPPQVQSRPPPTSNPHVYPPTPGQQSSGSFPFSVYGQNSSFSTHFACPYPPQSQYRPPTAHPNTTSTNREPTPSPLAAADSQPSLPQQQPHANHPSPQHPACTNHVAASFPQQHPFLFNHPSPPNRARGDYNQQQQSLYHPAPTPAPYPAPQLSSAQHYGSSGYIHNGQIARVPHASTMSSPVSATANHHSRAPNQPTYHPSLNGRPPASPTIPAVASPMTRLIKERVYWIHAAGQPLKTKTLNDAQQRYQSLLDVAREKEHPHALCTPLHDAVKNIQKARADLEKEGQSIRQSFEDRSTLGTPSPGEVMEDTEESPIKEGENAHKTQSKAGGPVADKSGQEEEVGAALAAAVVDGRIQSPSLELKVKPASETKLTILPPIDALKGVESVEPSKSITVKLHDHQVLGLSWLVHMYKQAVPAILGDQMGLGKTLQSIAFLAYLKDHFNISGPHLVVVPLSVMSNWFSEMERFCPSMQYVRFHGPKNERTRIKQEELTDQREFDVVVTTYEMLVAEVNFFRRKFFWRVVIVDEGHRLKNEKSQLSESLRRVPAFYRLILTGTPCQNNLRELWSLFHYLLPEVFTTSTAEKFEECFDAQRNLVDVDRLKQARALLSLLMLRRRKDQISMTLPPKTEVAVVCGLSDQQRAWYKRILTGVRESLLDGEGTGTDWRKLLNMLLQLRKVCNHPYLMTETQFIPDEGMVTASGKLKILDRMLPRLREDGHRVLLFSQFTTMLDILEEFCYMRGYDYVRLDGGTNRVQRRLDLRRFNAAGSQLFLFLISTRAGGQGINLASADTVVLYDSDWNPQVDIQAMERAHRIGQTKPVRVYRLVVRASVEERMISRAHKKLFLNEMVAEHKPTSFTGFEDLNDEAAEETMEAKTETKPPEEEDHMREMEVGESETAKDEVKRLLRTGVTALFEANRGGELTDEEIDILVGRKEGEVRSSAQDEEGEEEQEGKVKRYWQEARSMELNEVDLRHLEGVNYAAADKRRKVERKDIALADLDLGTRKRKQRLIKLDGVGTGYGEDVPVLASEFEDSQADRRAVAPAPPKRAKKTWIHESSCFLCQQPLQETGDPKQNFRCGHCPKVYHPSCLSNFLGGQVVGAGPAKTSVCPHHICITCNRSTAAAGGLLFRCVECPRAYCEDCLEDELIESLGRCKELENLGYYSKQSYFIRCVDCKRRMYGEDEEAGLEEEGAEGPDESEESEGERVIKSMGQSQPNSSAASVADGSSVNGSAAVSGEEEERAGSSMKAEPKEVTLGEGTMHRTRRKTQTSKRGIAHRSTEARDLETITGAMEGNDGRGPPELGRRQIDAPRGFVPESSEVEGSLRTGEPPAVASLGRS